METCFGRLDTQRNQCTFGKNGVCCRLCYMGPCRITPKAPRGVCGADADTIVARNYVREVASGTAAHSDHGRHLVLLLKKVAEGKGGSYRIADEQALRYAARLYGIAESERTKEAVALDLANLFISEFNRQEDPLATLKLAPVERQGVWRNRGIQPSGIDRMVVESLHRTHMGVDHDYRNLLLHAFRTSLADGWGGSRVASIASDILFGTPSPVRSRANLGVLGAETVNVLVHGHEPALSEMLAIASRDPEIVAEAKAAGAEGVTLAGHLLHGQRNTHSPRHPGRRQFPAAGTGDHHRRGRDAHHGRAMLHAQPAGSGAGLPHRGGFHQRHRQDHRLHAACLSTRHTRWTAPGRSCAGPSPTSRTAIRARSPFPRRRKPLVAGFSVAAIKYMLGGTYRASFRPLNDAIIQGRIKGIVGIVGCNNPQDARPTPTSMP